MNLKRMWLVALVALVMVAACGPDMATPIPTGQATAPTQAATPPGETPEATQSPAPGPAVDPNDWRTLGSADAKVTLMEYSDFQ
jgi:hypothetical protein